MWKLSPCAGVRAENRGPGRLCLWFLESEAQRDLSAVNKQAGLGSAPLHRKLWFERNRCFCVSKRFRRCWSCSTPPAVNRKLNLHRTYSQELFTCLSLHPAVYLSICVLGYLHLSINGSASVLNIFSSPVSLSLQFRLKKINFLVVSVWRNQFCFLQIHEVWLWRLDTTLD